MIPFSKTQPGALALRDQRDTRLSRRQRAVLILFDGRRSVEDVMKIAASIGVTPADIEALVEMGLIAAADPAPQPVPDRRVDSRAPPWEEQERTRCYLAAYPVAVGLISKLGLKIRAAQDYQGLVEMLPVMRKVFSEEELHPLLTALRW
jgi:hypothetical protein